jgi:hypothetical protein
MGDIMLQGTQKYQSVFFFRCIDKPQKSVHNYCYITTIVNRRGDVTHAAKSKNYERHDRSGRR